MMAFVRGDGGFDTCRVKVETGFIHFDEHRTRPNGRYGQRRSNEGVRRHDDFIPRADTKGFQRKLERIQSAGHPDTVPGADVIGKGLLKITHFLAQNEVALPHDGQYGRVEFVFERLVLRL